MVKLEYELTGHQVTRTRFGAIVKSARPGSVGRPKLPGLLARERRVKARIAIWSAKTGDYATTVTDGLKAELVDITRAIKAEKARKRPN